MHGFIIEAIEAFAELSHRELGDLHIYFPSLKMSDLKIPLSLQERGVKVTVRCLQEEQARNSTYSYITVTHPQIADVLVVDRASDFYSLRFPYRLKLIITLAVPVSTTLENMLAARGILCLHAPNLRIAAGIGQGGVKDFTLALLQQTDIPDTFRMLSEIFQLALDRYQEWEEIALLVRKVAGIPVGEKNVEEIKMWRRLPSVYLCRLQSQCGMSEGPDFLIQRQGRPLEIISLFELRALIASSRAIWVDKRPATPTVLEGLLSCKQLGCPFTRILATDKEAA